MGRKKRNEDEQIRFVPSFRFVPFGDLVGWLVGDYVRDWPFWKKGTKQGTEKGLVVDYFDIKKEKKGWVDRPISWGEKDNLKNWREVEAMMTNVSHVPSVTCSILSLSLSELASVYYSPPSSHLS